MHDQPHSLNLNAFSLKTTLQKSILLIKANFLKQLPYSLAIGLIYFLTFFDFGIKELSESTKIFLIGLWVFIPSLVCAMALVTQTKEHKFIKPFIEIPSLFGVLISVSLFPVIISFASMIVFWITEKWLIEFGLTHIWFGCTILLVCFSLISKILAPLFLLFEDEELNSAIDKSEKVLNSRTIFPKIYLLLILCILSYASLSWLEGYTVFVIKVGIIIMFNIIWVNIWVAIKEQLN